MLFFINVHLCYFKSLFIEKYNDIRPSTTEHPKMGA